MKDEINKKLSFGKHAVCSVRKLNEIEVELTLGKASNGKPTFSACASVWNARHTDILMGGQCLDTILEHCKAMRANSLYKEIVGLWERNHLNDMHAGTEAQEKAIHEWRDKNGGRYDYNEACDYLRSIGLYEDNGYKYGTGWLYREISDEDMKRIKEIMEIA